MCKCLSIIGRIVIGILSVIFALIGVVLLVFGIMVKVKADVLQQLFQSLLDSAKAKASTAVGGNFKLPTENFDINDLVGGLATAFIILGVVMLMIGVFGVAGACCVVKCMLIIYLVIVSLFLISQIILIIIAGVNRSIITDPPKPGLKESLQQEYQGVNGSDVTSLMWNVIMNGLHCCGIDGTTDFNTATKWKAVWGQSPTPGHVSPAACCKTGKYTTTDRTCATAPTAANSNKDIGCYDKVWDFILKGTVFIVFACVDIGGFAMLTVFAAIILHQKIQDSKVDF